MTNDDAVSRASVEIVDLANQWAENKIHVYQLANGAERIVRAALLASQPSEEWEVRADGVRSRKDRWEAGIRNIVTIMGGVREEFEVPEVVETVRKLLTGEANGPTLPWFTFPAEQPSEDKRDAERYRWLCLHPDWKFIEDLCRAFVGESASDFRQGLSLAIDAAIATGEDRE